MKPKAHPRKSLIFVGRREAKPDEIKRHPQRAIFDVTTHKNLTLNVKQRILFETSYVALVLAIQGCATAAKMNGAWSSRNSYMEQSQRNEWKSNEIPILMVLHSKAWRAANLTSKSVFAKIDSTKVNCSLFGSSTALLLNSPSLHSLGWNVQTFLSRGPKLCKKVCRFPCLDLGPSFDDFVE